MAANPDLKPILEFLKGLRRNNSRDWFESHRAGFQEARNHFEEYVASILHDLARTEPLGGVSPKDCIFRLNRDLRFTKDKSPYKTHMSAYIAPGGRKSRRLGYYVHIEPGDHSMLAGGLHEPDSAQIARWRSAIDQDPGPFKKIIGASSFKRYFGEVRGERLKTAPKGFPRDHPELALLWLKQVTVSRLLTDREILAPDLMKETFKTFKAMRPFLRYLDEFR